MAERWVLNASPLISLGKIGRLDLLSALADGAVVPPAGGAEVLRGADAASAALDAATHVQRIERVDILPAVALWGLGAGETEVLSLRGA